MLNNQKTLENELHSIKVLLSFQQSKPLARTGQRQMKEYENESAKQAPHVTSHNILVGTLSYMIPPQAGRATKIGFSPANWTGLSRRYELLCTKAFGAPQYYFRSYNIIERDHPAWTACAFGRMDELQQIFKEGLASPFDVTEDGANLLYVSPVKLDNRSKAQRL